MLGFGFTCCCTDTVDGILLLKKNEQISRWCRYDSGSSVAADWEITSSWVDPTDDTAEWVAIHPSPYNRVFSIKTHLVSSTAYAVIECWDFESQALEWDFETTAAMGVTDPGVYGNNFRYQTTGSITHWRLFPGVTLGLGKIWTSQSSGVLFRPSFSATYLVLVEPDGTRTEYPRASDTLSYTGGVTERFLQEIATYDWQDAAGLEIEYTNGGTATETDDQTSTAYSGGFGGTYSYTRIKSWKYDLTYDYKFYSGGTTDLSDYTCSGGTLIRTDTYDPNETTTTSTTGSGYPTQAAALAAAAADPPANPGAHPNPESVSLPKRGFTIHDVYNSTTLDVIQHQDDPTVNYVYVNGTLVDTTSSDTDWAAAVDGGGVWEVDGELYGSGSAADINDINGTDGESKILGVSDDFVLVFGLRNFATFSEGRYAGTALTREGSSVTNWQIWAYRLSDGQWYPMRVQADDDSEFVEIAYAASAATEDYAIDTVKNEAGSVYPLWDANDPAY